MTKLIRKQCDSSIWEAETRLETQPNLRLTQKLQKPRHGMGKNMECRSVEQSRFQTLSYIYGNNINVDNQTPRQIEQRIEEKVQNTL